MDRYLVDHPQPPDGGDEHFELVHLPNRKQAVLLHIVGAHGTVLARVESGREVELRYCLQKLAESKVVGKEGF